MSDKPETFHSWSLEYSDYDAKKEKSRESLLTIGNGYLGSRGAMEEANASDTNYPGTYIAGLYNRSTSKIADKDIENEDFVNVPNWLYLNFKINGGEWFDVNNCKLISINRKLDFCSGQLHKYLVVEDEKGRQTAISSKRFASMHNPHLVAMDYRLKPLNYSAKISFQSALDGQIINDGVTRYRDLNQKHIEPVDQKTTKNGGWLKVRTSQSKIEIAEAVKHTVKIEGEKLAELNSRTEEGKLITEFNCELRQNEEVKIEKIVSIYTSKKDDVADALQSSLDTLERAGCYSEVLDESKAAWKKLWQKIDIVIEGDSKSQMLVRLHLFHLMVAASPNNTNIDASIAARGLHGEAYRGHIFWDELYILPLYNLLLPNVAKSVLMYRYRRLNEARANAKQHGYSGAMFPWQSGSDGREETQVIHLNPVSGEWGDDYSSLQRHVSIAIAYNVWYYFHVTGDTEFMKKYGAEMFLEICRFWASKAKKDTNNQYSIANVMGPDEFHETNTNTKGGGLTDNAYTNIMVAWLFEKSREILNKLPEAAQQSVFTSIKFEEKELDYWNTIEEKLHIPVSDNGIIEQFDGYFKLKELDWEAYRKKYNNIYRLDRILKAEGKSPDDFKLAKQADTLMTFYTIDEKDVKSIVEKSGRHLPDDFLSKNYEYYLKRTSHGSTLSRVVHAYLANKCGIKEDGDQLYLDALQSDFSDIQGGTTAEGIHAGVMGATVLMIMKTFAGINFKKEILEINPSLPSKWEKLKFSFWFKQNQYFVDLTRNKLAIRVKSEISDQIHFILMDKKILLYANKKEVFNY
ncbi:glycoside hydrolase family 65 protein [Draconibacterium halophilum]|uniref:Glycoside hydrolase family 65 protein n=1 Tax=Draconibacterium halophilum TaxID=2706887 RepID=A0A6C0RE61_9BACT|nr:glycosyl hydrolase family 65 protein [Draconibacterium halophilum]QIA08968.1 glycoside hydrolase family 65 protein [Draconibacterium halophilum]